MLTKITQFVKSYQADIILVIGVILISLLSFAAGFITAKQQEKQPLRIEKSISGNSYHFVFIKGDKIRNGFPGISRDKS